MSLRFGTLTRHFCKRCGEDTLHRGLKCTREGCGEYVQIVIREALRDFSSKKQRRKAGKNSYGSGKFPFKFGGQTA